MNLEPEKTFLWVFLDWDKDLQNKFLANMNTDPNGVFFKTPRTAIMKAFTWANTPQGHSFWQAVHNKPIEPHVPF